MGPNRSMGSPRNARIRCSKLGAEPKGRAGERPRPSGREHVRICGPMKNGPVRGPSPTAPRRSRGRGGWEAHLFGCIQVPIGRIRPRDRLSKGSMKARWSLIVALLVAVLGLLGSSAWAASAESPSRTHARRPAHASHHRLRHGHDTLPTRNLVARRVAPVDRAPVAPRPRRGHRSATVPHIVHRVGAPRSLKGGGNPALTVSNAARHAEGVRMLRRTRLASSLASHEHPIVSGRGPPRASPARLPSAVAPPSFLTAPVASRRPTSPSISALHRIPLRGLLRPPLPDASASRLLAFDRGSLLGRLHACRHEGAATCYSMPSPGGSQCFA